MNSFAFSSSLCVLIVFFLSGLVSVLDLQPGLVSVHLQQKCKHNAARFSAMKTMKTILRSENDNDNILDDRDDKSRRLMKSWIWRVNDDAVPPLKSAPDAVRTKITNHD